MTSDSIYDVVIIGGGPVGMGLAIELGQRGIHTVVVERHETPQPIPKGQNLTQRTAEHFHFWGVEREIRAARTLPKEYAIGGMTCYGTLLTDYSYDWLQREAVRPYYFTDNERLPQYQTEAVLRKRVAEIDCVDVSYGWTGTAIRQTEDTVIAQIQHDETHQMRELSGRYLVGCDGSRSIVRGQAGIAQEQSHHDKLMVLLVFKSKELHELLKRYPDKSFYNVLHPDYEGYWLFFGRVDLGSTWFFHAPVPAGTTKENFDFAGYLHRAVGTEFDLSIEHIGFWDLRVSIAQKYQNKRVFVAGDAAHSHPPYGAFGINMGLEDARNLGWKLAAELQGWAGANLLPSYDEERRPVFESTAKDFIENYIETDNEFLTNNDPDTDKEGFEIAWNERASGASGDVVSFEPNYEGSSFVFGPEDGKSGAVGQHIFTARSGHHLAPVPLSNGHNIYDELGEGFTLIAFGADPGAVGEFESAAKALSIPFKAIEDSFSGERERYERRLILVRPDQFIVWVGDRIVPDACVILTRAIGLSGP